MKRFLYLLLFTAVLPGCEQEPAQIDVQVTVEQTKPEEPPKPPKKRSSVILGDEKTYDAGNW